MNQRADTREKVTELEGLRGILAWWVVASHLLVLSGIAGPDLPKPLRFLLHGDMPVDVFIVLSGFVIFMLLDKGRDTYATFITRRFFRLFPTYICCLAAMIPIGLFASQALSRLPWHDDRVVAWIISDWQTTQAHLWQHVLAHLTMLHGLLPNEVLRDSPAAILGPAWSISLEWQFYLVAPLLLVATHRSQRFLAALGLFIIVCTMAAPSFGDMFEKGRFLTYPLPAFLPLKGIYFFWGACSFYAYKHAVSLSKPEILSRLLIGLLIIVGALTRSVSLIIWCAVLGSHLLRVESFTPLAVRTITGLLNSRAIQWLGRISYSTYLCHVPSIYLVLLLLAKVRTDWNRWHFLAALTAGSVPLIMLVSHLLFTFVEKPFILAAKTWTANWNHRTPVTTRPLELDSNAT